MGIMLVVLGGTFTAMTNAMEAATAASSSRQPERQPAASMDLDRPRLPPGRSGPAERPRRRRARTGRGAPIVRPGPAARRRPAPASATSGAPALPAVTVGPDLGPPINGQCTDVITTLAADGAFENVNVAAIAANGVETMHRGDPAVDIGDIDTDDGGRRQHPRRRPDHDASQRRERVMSGDRGGGADHHLRAGRPAEPQPVRRRRHPARPISGTMDRPTSTPPADRRRHEQPGASSAATRVRMITYFVDTIDRPDQPAPDAAINANGRRTPTPTRSRSRSRRSV